jgi:hypothetical protein
MPGGRNGRLLPDQCGLAKAGRRGDEGELAMEARIQPLVQAWAGNKSWSGGGNVEFGL